MPDITMCEGGKCPLKEKCYRYVAEPSRLKQSWFKDLHLEKKSEAGNCVWFWKVDGCNNPIIK